MAGKVFNLQKLIIEVAHLAAISFDSMISPLEIVNGCEGIIRL